MVPDSSTRFFLGRDMSDTYSYGRYIPDNLYDLHDLRQVMFYRVGSVWHDLL